MKKSQFTAVQSRDMKPGLSHQSKESDRLEGNGLTTGVWTGDDKKIKRISKTDIDRNNFFLVDQRVAGFLEVDAAFVVKDRFTCIHLYGKCSSCKNKIKLYHDLKIEGDSLTFCCDLYAEVGKDDFDLFLFLKLKFTHVVVQFYNRHWFDKKCGTGGRLVVDHTRHLSLIFGFDRDTVSAVSHGDDSILKVSPCTAVYQSGKLRVDPVIGHFHAASDLAQVRACIVTDLIFGKDTAADLRRERCERGKSLKHMVKRILRCISTVPAGVGFDTGSILKKVTDGQDLQDTKRTSDLKTFQRATDVLDISKGDAALLKKACQCIACLYLHGTDHFKVSGWLQSPAEMLAHIGRCLFGKFLYDFGIFQCI